MPPTYSPHLLADRYRVGARLGRGGMGEVREGVELRLDREVAIKLLRPNLAASHRVRERFEREARASARISHPHVVAVYDTGESEGVPYIVMERLPGTTFADELARGPVDPERACMLATEVVAALEAAHRLGVVHRDIKPGNVLIGADGHAKVTDLGIATIADGSDPTTTGLVLGTAAYLAPERLAGESATPSSDLYSVGVVLYEALAGRTPFRAETALALVASIANGDAPSLAALRPDLDPALIALTERAIARDPEERFDSASAMGAALRARLSDVASESDEHPTVPLAVARAQRRVARTATVADTDVAPSPVPAATASARAARARRRIRTALIATVLVVAVIVGVLVLAVTGVGDGSDAPPPSTNATTPQTLLPQPLARAIDRLDRAVSP